ncbi:hypothetical protein Mgra_00007724 [Meloidogyne graminicola]|uniref:C2H2-type domain-containing protein n=1 Tax=Meloidogyne graminicola TaxID=189291 RepID=A0A8S9ZHT9_9BILA|nr:hypothetical protein Mgra_00007724 [Meloidogyne graminicola]
MLLSLFATNPNICSQQIPTNLFSSFQMPIKNNINFSMGIPSFEGETTNNSFNFLNKEINNLNKDYINLFDKKEEKAEKTGNDLKKLKDQQTNLSKKKRRANNENNKESWKFTKMKEKNEGNETNETLPQQSTTLFDLPYHMCPHCCLTFAETENYKAHLEMHQQPLHVNNGIDISNLFNSLQNDESLKQQVETKCPLCEMEFSNVFRLNEHVRLHNAHSCDICQKTFMTAFDLNLHKGTHTGFTYDCKDCGKCFPCRKTLAEHNRSHRIILSNNCKTSDKNNQNQLIDIENSQNLQNVGIQQNFQNGRKKRKIKKKCNTCSIRNFINSTNYGEVENIGNSSFGIMENILMRANSLLSVYGQNLEKIQETVDVENEQKFIKT